MKRAGLIAAAIFAMLAVALLAAHGNRVVPTNDEGILLEPAQRIALGAHPYSDFWAYMSPGSYWLQAAVFRLFGVSMVTGRVIVILDFALQCALVFWLAARLVSWRAATLIAIAFAGFGMADPAALTAQHRWDSGTLALAGIACATSGSPMRFFLSGALLAFAAWCTPAVALAGAAVALWLAIASKRRRMLAWFVAGVAATTLAATGLLLAQHSFGAFVNQMLWLRKNYSAANIMPYGSIIGGWHALFEGASGPLDWTVRTLAVICVALPAILPPLAIVAWTVAWARKKVSVETRADVLLLVLSLLAMVAAVFPRADVPHLAFASALGYLLVGLAIAQFFPPRAAAVVGLTVSMVGALFGWHFFNTGIPMATVDSPVGTVRVAAGEADSYRELFALVQPHETLFVYPYMPLVYFLTQAKNPTRYAYLNPGMSTHADELAVLADLKAQPPEWLLYLKLSREEFLRVFPHGDQLDWRFEQLESWLQVNYRPVPASSVRLAGYQLWERADNVRLNLRSSTHSQFHSPLFEPRPPRRSGN